MSAPERETRWTLASTLAAAGLPSLLAFNLPPSPTFLNQALAFACWGLVAVATGREVNLGATQTKAARQALYLPAALLLLLTVAACISWLWGSLPRSLFLSAVATLAASAVLTLAGVRAGAAAPSIAARLFAAFCLAWLLAGLLNSAIAGIQVFVPDLADGDWIARSALPGRAVGNLRQPNHLCTLLLWAMIGSIALLELGWLRPRSMIPILLLLAWALVLTASRTALVGVALLALWGLIDRRLSSRARWSLIGIPALFALAWLGMALWAGMAHEAFGAQQRLSEADLSASRFRIWSDSLQLIRAHPFTGVGFGEFNFAWSLSVLPQRPPAFFDHTHNLLLQWAVELGLPLALLLGGLLLIMLGRMAGAARQSAREGACAASLQLRVSLAFLLMMALHSQLEYPLWYAYFLLPTAWLLGFGLAMAASHDRHDEERAMPGADAGPSRSEGQADPSAVALLAAAGLLVIGSAASVADYTRVAVIFDGQSAQPLTARMARGQRSILFSHHADYAAATTSDKPEDQIPAFDRAAHYLLDTRLMLAWADALARSGDLARARHLAQRLREFRNPNSADYFAVCPASQDASSHPPASAPYQCSSNEPNSLRWTDFR